MKRLINRQKLIHGDFSAAGYFTAGMLVWVVGGPV
jgi:hypothetical protein